MYKLDNKALELLGIDAECGKSFLKIHFVSNYLLCLNLQDVKRKFEFLCWIHIKKDI